MKKRLSWKAWAALRLTFVMGLLLGGAAMLHAELSKAEEMDSQIQDTRSEAAERVRQGEEARRFHATEEPKIDSIEEKIQEATPGDINEFKAFCLAEAEREKLKLLQFRCELPQNEVVRKSEKEKKEKDSVSPFLEIPFLCQGAGNYGSVLRFSDRLYSIGDRSFESKALVAIDRFAFARTANFSSLFSEGRRNSYEGPTAKKGETSPESHSFLIEGRIFIPRPAEEEK